MSLSRDKVHFLITEVTEGSTQATRTLLSNIQEGKLQDLVLAADGVRSDAYAPYSGYEVGAAILFKNGEIVTGWNVENKSFPVSMCAESSAIAKLSLSQRDDAIAMAVVARSLPYPCGACRQRILEIGEEFLILVADDRPTLEIFTVRELLPSRENLKQPKTS